MPSLQVGQELALLSEAGSLAFHSLRLYESFLWSGLGISLIGQNPERQGAARSTKMPSPDDLDGNGGLQTPSRGGGIGPRGHKEESRYTGTGSPWLPWEKCAPAQTLVGSSVRGTGRAHYCPISPSPPSSGLVYSGALFFLMPSCQVLELP